MDIYPFINIPNSSLLALTFVNIFKLFNISYLIDLTNLIYLLSEEKPYFCKLFLRTEKTRFKTKTLKTETKTKKQ
jgi:hypothetical protein